jgi:hypothetical protein
MGSSSDEEGCEEESQSWSGGGGSRLDGGGDEAMTTVSVRAFPLESMVKITSVRGRGRGDSGMEDRLLGRAWVGFMGEVRPLRGRIRAVNMLVYPVYRGLISTLGFIGALAIASM